MSISTILPSLTVKPMTEYGRPTWAATMPAAPFTSAGRPNAVNCAKVSVCSATACAPRTSRHPPGRAPKSARTRTSRIEHREQRVEVTRACGGEEGVDHRALAAKVGVRDGRSPYPSMSAAGDLPRRRRGAAHDGRDLVEGHTEHVVQDEGEPLGRSQRVEHDEKGQTDRVPHERGLFWVDASFAAHDRLWQVRLQGILPP